MTNEELRKAYEDRIKVLDKHPGLKSVSMENRLVLTMPVPEYFINKSKSFPKKVKTPFGLSNWYPSAREDLIIIYPKLSQVEKYLKMTTGGVK